MRSVNGGSAKPPIRFMLKTRVITGLILGALLLAGLFLLPPRWAVLFWGAIFLIGAWEWAGFGAARALAARAAYTLAIAVLLFAAWKWTGQRENLLTLFGVAVAWWLLAFVWLLAAPSRHKPWLALLCGLPVLIPAFIALARLQTSVEGFARGPVIVLWLAMMVCAADVGAYFAGRSFGRHKLAPRVSPGKTWEGAGGGLAAVALMAWGGALHFGLPILASIAFGLCIATVSVIGDLTESMFKRAAALKDSGAILPGHGGMLDRLDSVTAAAPLYALGLFGSGVIR
jgi:phosphatidate cytidylyltransferase